MEQYRKKLKLRMLLFSIIMLFCVVILLINQFGANDTQTESMAISFQVGFAASGTILLAVWLWKYRRALSDEAKLRLLYNQENDERMKAIRAKAGVPMVLILSLALVLAGMVIGYWSETIFVVLICVALFQLTMSMLVKLYYMRKM
jgi:cytochrome b561